MPSSSNLMSHLRLALTLDAPFQAAARGERRAAQNIRRNPHPSNSRLGGPRSSVFPPASRQATHSTIVADRASFPHFPTQAVCQAFVARVRTLARLCTGQGSASEPALFDAPLYGIRTTSCGHLPNPPQHILGLGKSQ